jgi:SAM-dependent methyltransferase
MLPAELDTIARLETTFWWYRGMNRLFLKLLDRELAGREPTRILDAGCGTGRMALALERRFAARVHALDLEPRGLSHGRRLGVQSLVQGDIRALPYRAESFPLVVSLDVLVHLPRGDEAVALSEFTRVLEPGGLLALRVAAFSALRSRHSIHVGERQRFRRSKLHRAASRAGLNCRYCTYANALLLPLAFLKFRLWEPLIGAEPASGVRPMPRAINKLMEQFLRAEGHWLQSGFSFPLGQSIILFARKPEQSGPTE